jgi:hypothetical protein
MFFFVTTGGMRSWMSDQQVLASVLAAIVHDVVRGVGPGWPPPPPPLRTCVSLSRVKPKWVLLVPLSLAPVANPFLALPVVWSWS